MAWKVEFGFDTSTGGVGNAFVLDDPMRGQLDNPLYGLGGISFVDVSQYLKSVSINRGKSRDLDRFQTGIASVNLDNRSRAFDPTYTASPYYGNIVPHREIRISYGSIVMYRGIVDDWNLTYDLNGNSIAQAVASDGFTNLTNQTLDAMTMTAQYSGARVTAILDDPNVLWPSGRRDIDTGVSYLGADTIAESTNALQYLQLIETTETGALFVSKSGDLTFRDRGNIAPTTGAVVLADNATQGIPFGNCTVNYGSELLFNQVVLNRVGGPIVQADDIGSQGEYGINTLTYSDLLMAAQSDAESMAEYLATIYANPEYRFESVEIILESLSQVDAETVMNLELTNTCRVIFTPNSIPPAIEQWCQVISQTIAWDYSSQLTQVNLGFSTFTSTPLVLDDPVFGKLDSGILGY